MGDPSFLRGVVRNVYHELSDLANLGGVVFPEPVVSTIVGYQNRPHETRRLAPGVVYEAACLLYEDEKVQEWATLGINENRKFNLDSEIRLLTIMNVEAGLFSGIFIPEMREKLIMRLESYNPNTPPLLKLSKELKLTMMGKVIGDRRELESDELARQIYGNVLNTYGPPKETLPEIGDAVLAQ